MLCWMTIARERRQKRVGETRKTIIWC
uniref:Uncharacterized protein n=1 Tax=Rhizophora mucronata TaxID=61149 RepID=A0A2P2QGS4_RHIMU